MNIIGGCHLGFSRGAAQGEVSMRLATLGAAVCLAILAPVRAADADSKHLSLGEIAVVPTNASSMTGALKSALESELKDLDLRGAHKDAILSVSLVRLDTDRRSSSSESARNASGVYATECVVSATLRSRNGVLFAMVEGRARAVGSDHVSENAMRGAVHGALSRVPEALK
jgi:hypothetical protein